MLALSSDPEATIELNLILDQHPKESNAQTKEPVKEIGLDISNQVSRLLNPNSQQRRSLKGIYFQIFALLCGTTLSAVRKTLPHISSFQLLFVRTPFILIAVLAYFYYTKTTDQIRKSWDRLMLFTAACLLLADTLFFMCVGHLPMCDVTTIMCLIAILNGLLASIFLGEPYLGAEKMLGAFSFLGVFFVVRPPFIFGSAGSSAVIAEEDEGYTRYIMVFVAIISALFYSATQVAMRAIKNQWHPFVLIFHLNFLAFVFYGAYFAVSDDFVAMSGSDYFKVALISALTIGAIFGLTKALEVEKPSVVGVIGYLQLLFSLVLDLMFGVLPSVLTLIGALIIVISCLMLIRMRN